jgi:hypothetical protein
MSVPPQRAAPSLRAVWLLSTLFGILSGTYMVLLHDWIASNLAIALVALPLVSAACFAVALAASVLLHLDKEGAQNRRRPDGPAE